MNKRLVCINVFTTNDLRYTVEINMKLYLDATTRIWQYIAYNELQMSSYLNTQTSEK